jgi:hypothetical protein
VSGLRLDRLVVGVESLEEAARVFAERLELPGVREGEAHRVGIGASSIELSETVRPKGMSQLVLRCDDLEATASRLRERGVPFRREEDGALRLEPEATHGVPIVIRG